MRTLDITYQNEEGHTAGAEIIDYEVGGSEVFINTFDWYDGTGQSEAVGTIRKSDIPKLIAFLQTIEVD